jgi:hypothetical protein
MNKEKYNEIIDEVYDKYTTKYVGYDDVPSKELFLFEIRTNKTFSEKWGLKIEEKELSELERMEIGISQGMWKEFQFGNIYQPCDEKNIPTKLITITYNNETLESYE